MRFGFHISFDIRVPNNSILIRHELIPSTKDEAPTKLKELRSGTERR